MTPFQALAADDPERVGRYRLVARLGAGGMGRVFLARSPGGRPVAVKVVRAELAEDEQFRRRFAREVAAARRVNGFFTAVVVDADPEGSPPWLATAYVAGMPLVDAVAAHGPWPERSVRALGAGLAEALEAIHAAGLVHRDLKPSNVLLAADGPRVIDFGISQAAEQEGTSLLTQAGAVVGTPGFISPEQLKGAGAGPASDVFALGAVLVYAATGSGPFGTGGVQEVNFRAAYEPAALGGVPAALRDLLGRCLAKDPARRPGVAEVLAAVAGEADGPAAGGAANAAATAATAARAVAASGWLPAPVARAVNEQGETALPATPPKATPTTSAPPPPPRTPSQTPHTPHTPHTPNAPNAPRALPGKDPDAASGPGAGPPPGPPPGQPYASPPPMSAVTGVFGPPSPLSAPRPEQRALSRRRLLAMAGGTAAVGGLGLLVWRLSGSDGGGSGTGGTDGGGSGSVADGGSGGVIEGVTSGDDGATGQPRTVRIAVQGPLTGANASLGQDVLEVVRLAVNAANDSGDFPDLRFEVLAADDEGAGPNAIMAAQEAIDDEAVLAVVGPLVSISTAEAATLYGEAGLAAVTPSATRPDLTEQDFGTFLRAVPDDDQVGVAIADVLRDPQFTSVVLVSEDSAYSELMMEAVATRMEEHGLSFEQLSLSGGLPDMDAIAQRILDLEGRTVVFCGYYNQGWELVTLLRDYGYDGVLIGTDGLMDEQFLTMAGEAAEGVLLACTCVDLTVRDDGQAFADHFENVYGRRPDLFASRALDVTGMIIETIAELGPDADRKQVFQALAGARYEGVAGPVSFTASGEYVGEGPHMFSVEDGAFEPLGPARYYPAGPR